MGQTNRFTMFSLPRFLLLSSLSPIFLILSQPPTSKWTPNFQPLGLYCYKSAPNPNMPSNAQQHGGGCGCENTQFRWTDGELYIMESTGHSCDQVFSNIGYNSTRDGDCSYFRIRHMITGRVIANVSESLQHSFFSAVADYAAKPLPLIWVFGP